MTEKMIRLDLGCGKNKRNDGEWIGVDSRQFTDKEGKELVDQVVDLTVFPWPWDDNSVDEVHASHFVEHLTAEQRVKFINELHRILKPGAKAAIITPHYASNRAYGDLTHQWPPVAEMWYYYLNKKWREEYTPHCDMYTCDFDSSWGYSLSPDITQRNQQFQNFALQYYREAAQDLHATIIKRAENAKP